MLKWFWILIFYSKAFKTNIPLRLIIRRWLIAIDIWTKHFLLNFRGKNSIITGYNYKIINLFLSSVTKDSYLTILGFIQYYNIDRTLRALWLVKINHVLSEYETEKERVESLATKTGTRATKVQKNNISGLLFISLCGS